LEVDPGFDTIRDDSRFQVLLKRMGFRQPEDLAGDRQASA
jgi:hypothetical protein